MFSSHTSYTSRSLPDHHNHSLKCVFLVSAASQPSSGIKNPVLQESKTGKGCVLELAVPVLEL